ncbi:MAG: aldehyde dehydrogenase, partial [Roseiflexus castenholzii]
MPMTHSDTPEYRFYLAGEWRTGAPYTVACPYDGAPVAVVHRTTSDDLEQAIQAAVAAFRTTRST